MESSIMVESTTLLNSQLNFLDTRVALIHIPLTTYPLFTHAILQLLLHNDRIDENGDPWQPHRPWMYWHPFVNVSVTSNECSIVCPREQASALFAPILDTLAAPLRKHVSISAENYSVIAISGPGLDPGARVLDLSAPLAMAGIPIFFITSYYADFILVPHPARTRVIRALESRGFVFEPDANASSHKSTTSDAGHMANPASPMLHPHHRKNSSGDLWDYPFPPGGGPAAAGTPPAETVSELQTRTFQLLRRHGVAPAVDRSCALVTCAGYKDVSASSGAAEAALQLGLTRCLTASPAPRFLSVTLTDAESASVTLERRFAEWFDGCGAVATSDDFLLGRDGPGQVSITFDLHGLPRESTGIVCGVAARLTDGMRGRVGHELFNLSFLSTATAGHVIVYEEELDDALDALKGLEKDGLPLRVRP